MPKCESAFQLRLPDGYVISLTLANVSVLSSAPRQRQAFSLVFSGPRIPRLPQGTYQLEHQEMGFLEIFIVPIRETAEERHYEAVFS